MMRAAVIILIMAGLLAGQKNVADTQVQESIRQYRQAWQGMSAAQQRQTIESGGFTPDQYERMLTGASRGNAAGSLAPSPASPEGPARTAGPDYSRRPNSSSVQSLQTPNEDLNSLRDTNVRRVNKTGCPPEVAMRITELKSKLGVGKAVASEGSSELIDRWHQRTAVPIDQAKERERLLDWVLGVQPSQKTQDQATQSQNAEAELQRLMTMCPEVR